MDVPSAITLGDQSWLWPAAVALLLAGVAVVFAYRPASWPFARRAAAITLKVAGFALVLACLVEPLWSGTRVAPGENLFLLLVDNSASLQIADHAGGPTRGDQIRDVLARDGMTDWQAALEQQFDVRRYTFDARLETTEHYDELAFDRSSSRLYSAAVMLQQRFQDRPVAGVLLFTDGNATDRSAPPNELARFAPVYPVVWPETTDQLDVSIDDVTVTQSPFEDAPVAVQASIQVTGGTGEVVGQLLREDGTLVQEQRATVTQPGLPVPLRFEVQPAKPGLEFYRVRVALADQVAQFDDPAASGETVLANNSRIVTIEQDPEPHRILYVSGRPNWEFKFLRRSVESDVSLQLVGLVRIAKKEAKFEFRGRDIDRGNALFQGFDADRETDAEAYDEPVVVRVGTRDEAELRNGFPKTKQELYEYRAVIIDDVEAAFFSRDQLSLLEQYVSDRGGSLLMLGGPDSFAHGGYGRTIVEDMLPFYLERGRLDDQRIGEYRWKLTRDGWLQSWTRLRRTEADEEQRIADMPAFRSISPASVIKPAARTLAEVRDMVGEDHPALVAQQYGEGKVAAMLVGDAWRWPLNRDNGQSDDYARAWRQLLRWLVVDVPAKLEVAAEQESPSATAVKLVARVHDAAFEPVDGAAVEFTVRTPEGKEYRLDADPSLAEPGVYTTDYAPREAGGYRATAAVNEQGAADSIQAELGWASDPSAEEFRRINVDRELLQSLADATHGEVLSPEQLPEFVESLPSREAPRMEAWTRPLWHTPWMLLAAIACFAGEWGLRRWRGLP
ncbi:MAG: FixH family protein [Planctomycetaceae bacterium]|nr:FixH family protein [Planctomycetaceae bacterium]